MRAVRKAFFELLNGAIVYNGQTVPVRDEIVAEGEGNLYVILSNQTKSQTATQCQFIDDQTIVLDIVDKTGNGVTKDRVDEISEIIYDLVINAPGSHNLPEQTGYIMQNVREDATNYITATLGHSLYIIRKLVTYRLTVIKQ